MAQQRAKHTGWSWILIVTFFLLSILNVFWGLLGILCMAAPLYHALRGRGRLHCSHYCPRGSFLGKFLDPMSLRVSVPGFMKTVWFRHTLLALMVTLLTISMIHTGGEIRRIAFALFRFMAASFAVGVLMGIVFRGRTWCAVCPMGHASQLVSRAVRRSAA